MAKKVAWGVLFILIAALLQSTIFSYFAVHIHAAPDLALGILVFIAYINGTMAGQLTGFFSGFLIDFLSAAPIGFNAVIRTLIGALAGFIKGTFFLDFFFLPMALCAGATVLKVLLYFLLHQLMGGIIPSYSLFEPVFWIEMAMNTVSAPFLFWFLKLFQSLLVGQREGV